MEKKNLQQPYISARSESLMQQIAIKYPYS